MEKEEILVKSKKCLVGGMEKQKINRGNWLAIIIAGSLAVVFMIVEGVLGHYASIFAIGAVCHAWAWRDCTGCCLCSFASARLVVR